MSAFDNMRALFIPTLCSGVTYWRGYNFVNAAIRNKESGAHLLWWQKNLTEIHPWQFEMSKNEYYARILNEMDIAVKCADIIVVSMVHTENGLNVVKGIREMYGKPVVMEIDDNILSTPSYNPAHDYYSPDSKLRKLALEQMRESDAVIVTTPHLKKTYLEFNEHIYEMPNSLDFDLWGACRRKARKGKVVVGWAGGASHNHDLEIILPAVEYFEKNYPEVEFRIVHGISPELKDRKNVTWSKKFVEPTKYPQYIAQQGFDIALAPLVDNNFNRSKSNLRWLESAAFGVPCVASNVGHFSHTITNGVDGFLCDDSEAFIHNIEKLVTNRKMRSTMGQAARNTAMERFNVDTVIKQYRTCLEEIIYRGQVKKAKQDKDSNYKMEAEVI